MEMVAPMNEMKRNEFMIQVLTELAPEIRAARAVPRAIAPLLSDVLPDFQPLPAGAVFLGVASDGLPVLLSLKDSLPGPMLIAGDPGTGKTNLLQVIARGIDRTHNPRGVQYGVITAHPDEWEQLGESENRVGIFPAHEPAAQEFLETLDEWAHANHGDQQSVLLLIDDLTSILHQMDEEACQSLRWLLLRGPARRVWPIVTVNPQQVGPIHPWTSFFHTRLFGKVANPRHLDDLTGGSRPSLDRLAAGNEFMLREGSDWLKFWIPAAD